MPRPPTRNKSGLILVGRSGDAQAQRLMTIRKMEVSQTALRRVTLANKASTLGTPLTLQVKNQGSRNVKNSSKILANWSPNLIGSLCALSASLLWLIPADLIFIALAACVLYAVGYAVTGRLQIRRITETMASELDLAIQFDGFLMQMATRLPQEGIDALQSIKTTLARLLPRMASIKDEGILSHEDIFFIRQVIERYLPDATAPYFALPQDQRDNPLLDQGATPTQLLLQQFSMMADKLKHLHEKVVKADAEKLAQHKRFLEHKTFL
ncbi:MAG: hypothetical protein V4805_04915 [Pseudomonadota bacterium]